MLEQLQAKALEYGQVVLEVMSQPYILIQIGIIVILFLPAWLLSNKVEPILEERARRIKGFPGLLRIIVAFLRRFEWVFFVVLLGVAYAVTAAIAWPENNRLIYAIMLLSGAWLLISVFSHAIKSRVLGRLFSWVAWIYVAALVFGVVEQISTLLDSAGFSVGTFRLSLLNLIKAAFFLSVLLWASSSFGNFVDRRIQGVEELTPSLRVLLGKIIRIALIVVAVLVAMSGIGIDLTALTVLSGAVGVGIGFGLQKVVSNFISGIIILMDQSIKPGDTISLGDTFGWIRELRARFVSVITRDGREFLIPNEDFITQQVINWSFTDKYVRLDVNFGVTYDADPHFVSKVAREAAGTVERVDTVRKPPVCWLIGFGDSSLDFRLRFWIDDPQKGLTNIRGKVMLALWDALKENDIAIPYPHRTIIMKSPPAADPAQG